MAGAPHLRYVTRRSVVDGLKLLQMVATLAAIAATFAGAGAVVRTSPPGKRGAATALGVAMLVAVVAIPIGLGIAGGTGRRVPAKVASVVLLGSLLAVTLAGVVLRIRHPRR